MVTAPAVVLFDVNETLSDLSPMADRFADVGAPPERAALWFAALLRDAFALTVAGTSARFAELAAGGLRVELARVPLDRDLDDAVEYVLAGFLDLPVHPDVPPGIERLAALDLRLATLSNGAAQVAEGLLGRAGLRDRFERILSVEDAGVWKPAPGAYTYAARECGLAPGDVMLVAVHPWDVDGARRAGLRSAWINRDSSAYPDYFASPEVTATSLVDLAAQLDPAAASG